MKRHLFYAAVLGILSLSPTLSAQCPQPEQTPEASALSPVAKAISELPAVCGTLNTTADYYIYLYSAGWCGPCRRIMPQIVQLYKDTFSKEKRVEIILLSADVNSDEAKKYVEHYDVGFYTIPARNNPQADNLPGAYQVRSIPHCIAVDKEGNRLFAGHASLLFRNLDKLK